MPQPRLTKKDVRTETLSLGLYFDAPVFIKGILEGTTSPTELDALNHWKLNLFNSRVEPKLKRGFKVKRTEVDLEEGSYHNYNVTVHLERPLTEKEKKAALDRAQKAAFKSKLVKESRKAALIKALEKEGYQVVKKGNAK